MKELDTSKCVVLFAFSDYDEDKLFQLLLVFYREDLKYYIRLYDSGKILKEIMECFDEYSDAFYRYDRLLNQHLHEVRPWNMNQ